MLKSNMFQSDKEPVNRISSVTTVKTKKNITRSLKNAVLKYDVVCLGTTETHLDTFNLNTDEISFTQYYYDIGDYGNIPASAKLEKVIYDKSTALIQLKDYNIILEELFNMKNSFSIGYIKGVQELIEKYVENKNIPKKYWTTNFFEEFHKYPELVLYVFERNYHGKDNLENSEIEHTRFNNQMRKFFTQLKNRIMFRSFNFYKNTSNNEGIQLNDMNIYDIVKSKFEYAQKYYWIFHESFIKDLLKVKRKRKKEERNRFLLEQDLQIYQDIYNLYNMDILETDDELYQDAVNIIKLDTFNMKYDFKRINPYEEYRHKIEGRFEQPDDSAEEYIKKYNKENSHLPKIVDRLLEDEDLDEIFESLPIDEEYVRDSTNKDEFIINELSPKEQLNRLYNKLVAQIDSDNLYDNPYYEIRNIVLDIIELIDNNIFTKTGRVRNKSPYCIKFREKLREDIAEYYFRKNLSQIKNSAKIFSIRYSKKSLETLKSEYIKTNDAKWLIDDKLNEVYLLYKKTWMMQYKIYNNTSWFQRLKEFDYKTLQFNQKDVDEKYKQIEEKKKKIQKKQELAHKEFIESIPLRIEPIINHNDEDDPFK